MASVYERYYERQPGAVKVIVVAGLGLLGYSLYRSIKRNIDEKNARQAADAAGGELAQLAAAGVYPTYTESEFYNFVHTLAEAMNGCGTDESAIFDVFSKMRNAADVRKLVVSFDIQYYRPCAASDPISYGIYQFNDKAYGGDLATWLSYDLSSSDIARINSILSSKGIEYQF